MTRRPNDAYYAPPELAEAIVSMIDKRTDGAEYGCLIWKRGYRGLGEILPPLEWR